MRGTDVVSRSGGVVVVVRSGRSARTVPVLSFYHDRLLAAAAFAGESLVIGGTSPTRRNVTSPLTASLAGGRDLPRIEIARLRATWLVACAETMGLKAFMDAAGIICSQRLGPPRTPRSTAASRWHGTPPRLSAGTGALLGPPEPLTAPRACGSTMTAALQSGPRQRTRSLRTRANHHPSMPLLQSAAPFVRRCSSFAIHLAFFHQDVSPAGKLVASSTAPATSPADGECPSWAAVAR